MKSLRSTRCCKFRPLMGHDVRHRKPLALWPGRHRAEANEPEDLLQLFLNVVRDTYIFKINTMKKSFRFLAFAAIAAMILFSCEKEPKAETATVDFEGAYWSALIDNPQYGGTLIYGTSYDETTWTWSGAEGYTWTDANTTLGFDGFPDAWGSRCFSSGGEVISNYVVADYTGASSSRQLEVPVAPRGGSNFVVHFGSDDPTQTSKVDAAPVYPRIRFADNSERIIKSIDVCLTNYVLNSCVNGDGFFGPITGSTALSIKAVGFDAKGVATKTSTVVIIDGNDAEAYKAGTKKVAWRTWDLSALGAVNGIIFCVLGTEDCYGDYGFNAPAYFAYDNIVVETPLAEEK